VLDERKVFGQQVLTGNRRFPMHQNPLHETLARLGRRVLVIDGATGIVWGTVAALACLVCGIWLDLMLELPAGLRITFLVSAVMAAAAVFARGARGALLAKAPQRLAERLDHFAASGGQIRSAVDLTSADPRTFVTHRPELSVGLARLAIERGSRIASAVPQRSVAPAGAVGKSLGALTLAGVCALVFIVCLPRLAATEWRRFADPFGDHPPFSTVTFSVEPGDVQVVYGAGLEVRGTVSGPPVEGVELVLQFSAAASEGEQTNLHRSQVVDEEVVPMFPEERGQWRASVANITRPLNYFLRSRGARSRRFSVDVLTVPKIEEVQFRITPPTYTQQATYEGPLPREGLAGLAGTEVRISIRSNRPLATGRLTYIVTGQPRRDVQIIPHDPAHDRQVSGTFSILGNGRIEALVTDAGGQESTDKVTAPVTLVIDERPFVRLIEPRAVAYATPTATIPVVISAEDDYGVSRLQLFRSLNDSRSLPLDVQVPSPPARLVHQAVPLPLRDYGLEPGDEIKLFARVEDNDAGSADAGTHGKGAESSVAVIRIISQEEFEQYRQSRDAMESLMAKYQQASRRLESLAEEIEKLQSELRELKPGEEPSPELREKLKELSEKMAREAEALRKLAQEKQPLAIDEELTKELDELASQIDQLQKSLKEVADNDQAQREEIEKRLAELADALKEKREQLDNEVLDPLEKLQAVLPLMRDEQKFVSLYLRQRELAERLASLKGRDGGDDPALKARMRDLEDAQRKIRTELEALLADIEEHISGLPEEAEFNEIRESAREFVEALRDSRAAEAMLEAENGLAEFSGTRGHSGADEAARILEQFVAKAGQMGQQGGGQALRGFRPQLGGAMRQTLQQMLNRRPGKQQAGQGGGDGYSMAQNTADNVGLYGSDQNYSESSAGGAGQRQPQSRGGKGTRAPGRAIGGTADGSLDAPGGLRAGGGTDAAIPLRYRRQVGRYFQRVADELGDSEK
jgi:hypothetical protein